MNITLYGKYVINLRILRGEVYPQGHKCNHTYLYKRDTVETGHRHTEEAIGRQSREKDAATSQRMLSDTRSWERQGMGSP